MNLLFQKKVFEVVKKIPKGRTLSYKEVAVKAGSPRAFRVVDNILDKNKDSRIPCHQVIRTDRNIGGYNRGKKTKISLLRKEGVKIKNGIVP